MSSLALNKLLEPDNQEKRKQLKALFKDPLFTPIFNLTLAQEREIALKRLKTVADAKGISVFDFEKNPLNVFACHEVCGMVDKPIHHR
jgi:acyl-CoA oxidase